jgi:surface protein
MKIEPSNEFEKGIAMTKGALATGIAALGMLSAVVVAALGMLPTQALAATTEGTVQGKVTVALQGTQAAANASAEGTVDAVAQTGDATLLLALGFFVLIVGAACLVVLSGKPVVAGAHTRSVPIRGRAVAVTVVAALVAGLFFGAYASRSAGAAEGDLSALKATASVVVDEQGNVVSGKFNVVNGCAFDVEITGVKAPMELDGLTAEVSSAAIAVGASAQGSWEGKQVAASTVDALKANNGKLELSMQLSVVYNPFIPIDFSKATVDIAEKTYNGRAIEPEVAITGLAQGTDYTVLYESNVNAGTGKITVNGAGKYEGQQTYEFEIAPATLTVTTPSAQKQYDGAALTSAGTIEGFVNGETAEFVTTGSQTGVGSSSNSYAISWNGTAKQANYTISETVGTLEVTANTAKIDVTAGSAEKTYDGSALASSEVTVTGLPEGFTCSATTVGSQTDAGTSANTVAEFAILGPDGKNVTEYFMNIEKHEGVLRVNKRDVTVRYNDIVSVVDKVYDGTTKAELSGAAVLEGIVAGENLGVTQDANFDFPSAGSCMVYVSNVQLTGAAAENYEIRNVVADRLVGNILPIEAELEWDGLSVIYDGQTHVPTAKVANAVAGETVAVTVDGTQTNAGAYTATATALSSANYTLPAGGAATAEFTIVKANPTPSAALEDGYTIAAGDKLLTIDLPTCTNGTYAWETPAKTYSEGTHQASVIFTPNDQNNYNVVAFTVSITANQKTAFAVYSADDNSLCLYKRATVPNEGSTFEGKKVTKTYTGIESDYGCPWDGCQDLVESVKVVDEGIKPGQTSSWFQGFYKVTSIDLTGLDTSSVTEMWEMFYHCGELEILKLSDSFDTSKVVSMESMFNGCSSLASLDLPDSFDTSSVADMNSMFAYCHSLQLDCSKWKVSTSCEHTDFNYLAHGVIEPNWD